MATYNTTYSPPLDDPYKDWAGRFLPSFEPNERQKAVLNAVREALDSRLFYASDVLAFCIKRLGVTQAQADVDARSVSGGRVGMDIFYARDALERTAFFAAERDVLIQLRPSVNQQLGTLVFNDGKRNSNMRITALSQDSLQITMDGKRDKASVRIESTPVGIRTAIDRAAEAGFRRKNFEQTYFRLPVAKPSVPVGRPPLPGPLPTNSSADLFGNGIKSPPPLAALRRPLGSLPATATSSSNHFGQSIQSPPPLAAPRRPFRP